MRGEGVPAAVNIQTENIQFASKGISQAAHTEARIKDMICFLSEQHPSVFDSFMGTQFAQYYGSAFDDDSNLPPPKPYQHSMKRIAGAPPRTTLTRNSSWNDLKSEIDVESVTSRVESKPRAHSMPNLFNSRSAHNRIMGISVLTSEQETRNGREKEKCIALARVVEFEELLGEL